MNKIIGLSQFFSGASMMAALALGLLFLRFWKTTGDRLFLMFAGTFWLFSLERVVLILMKQMDEMAPYSYLMRLVAFFIIIVAILDKNFNSHRY